MRADHDARDGQADRAVAQRGARGARTHRLEHRARRRGRSRRRSSTAADAPAGAHHLRAGRCRRARQRVELSLLRRAQLDRSGAARRATPCCTSRRSTRRSPACGSSTSCTGRVCRSTWCTRSSVAVVPAPRSSTPTSTWCASPGRTRPGGAVASAVADRLMRVQLELGGKDGAYVCDDVDVDGAALAIAEGAFYNGGQSCCAIERVYVHEAIFDRFVVGVGRRGLRLPRRRSRRGCHRRRTARARRAARRPRSAGRRRGASAAARCCAAGTASTGPATGSSRPCSSTFPTTPPHARRELRAGHRCRAGPRRRRSGRVHGRHRVRSRCVGVHDRS